MNISRLQNPGVRFCHGDVRGWEDLEHLPEFDLLIDCSVEPSVQAGAGDSPRYVLNTNNETNANLNAKRALLIRNPSAAWEPDWPLRARIAT